MLEFHPYADLFPLIEGKAFEDLVEDVRANGIREPIVLLDKKILDGRNRYRAGVKAGVIGEDGQPTGSGIQERAPKRWFLDSEGDPLQFVISANLHRRHLDDGQRAMVAAKLANLGHGGKRAKPDEQAANWPVEAAPAVSQAQAAQALNVAERQVRRAKVVLEEGVPELVKAAQAGRVAVSLAADLARLPKAEQREVAKSLDVGVLYEAVKPIIKRQKEALVAQKKAKRSEKEKRLGAKQRALPKRKYGVIYADPAWKFVTRSEDTGMDRAPENHYPTMTTEEICALPVYDIAAPDCVLFLWATAPMIRDALRTMDRWGFDYKSQYIWDKEGGAPGLGYWGRIDHELLLIGTCGNPPCPAPGTQWSSVIRAPAGKHSAKPDIVRKMIEQYFPTLPKIELNAREAHDTWDVWGNEAPEAEAPQPETDAPFIVEHAGVRAIIVTGSYGPEIYAVDLNAPFPSETGFHSLLGYGRKPGEPAIDHARRLIDTAIAYNPTGKKGTLRPMRLPERAYRLPPGADGKPIARERGVWVDRDAPPFGLDAGLLDGCDVIRARWSDEDRAGFSGQKIKRTCPKSLHPNHKIIAVNGQMLTPVAEFPTSGAYVVTSFKWIDGNRVEGWAYVDEAAFHDGGPMPATGDLAENEIPAFLRRKPFVEAMGDLADELRGDDGPERCLDTLDMLAGEGA